MTEKETLSDGKRITRDEFGRFRSVELDSETARAMARSKLPNKAINTTSEELLRQAGFSPGTEPEHLKILAEIASSKRSGAVPAMRAFLRLTQAWEPASEPAPSNMREVEPLFDDGNWDCVKIGGGAAYVRIPGQFFGDLVREMRELDAGG